MILPLIKQVCSYVHQNTTIYFYRYLFWSNTAYKNASVERLRLDGSGHRTIIVNKDLARPNAIVVDQTAGRLFWVDEKPGAEFCIESTDLDGNDRRILHSGKYTNMAVAVLWGQQVQPGIPRSLISINITY